MSDRYQVFFRTSKGGCGLDYDTVKAEFLSVFRDEHMEIIWENPGRMRMELAIHNLTPCEIAYQANDLGYTQGIVSIHEEPYRGEKLESKIIQRWAVGWIRKGDKKLLLTEIYRQNEEKILSEAPHNRIFLIKKEGEIVKAKGHRYHRGLSPFDARFILNITELKGDEFILDPFAGMGGILIECRRRDLLTVACDIDITLSPGLAHFSGNRFCVADAGYLPFADNSFDVIITEPPFGDRFRKSVLDSIRELLRVIRRNGKIVFLIAQDMYDGIVNRMIKSDFKLVKNFSIRRHSKLISYVLRFDGNIC
jgi:SAM-dependent methyltransferase